MSLDNCLLRELVVQDEADAQAVRADISDQTVLKLQQKLDAAPSWWTVLKISGGTAVVAFIVGGLAL